MGLEPTDKTQLGTDQPFSPSTDAEVGLSRLATVTLLDKEHAAQYEYSDLHEGVKLGFSQIEGLGLFATQFIEKGTVIWTRLEEVEYQLTQEEVDKLPDNIKEEFLNVAYQIGEKLWGAGYDPRDPESINRCASDFYNHSCDPTTLYIEGGEKLIASRDLHPGDEITYDYATEGVDKHLECRCGSDNCRGALTPDDWKRPDLQERYAGHFFEHVQARIDAQNQQ